MNKIQAEAYLSACGHSLDTVTRGEAAKAWGVSRDKARHWLSKFRTPGGYVDTAARPVKAETVEITDNELKYEIPNTRIHTLEGLIEKFKVDTEKWSCVRFVANKYEVGAKNASGELVVEPLYQVKAFFEKRKITDIEVVKNEIERLKEEAKRDIKPFNINKIYAHSGKSGNALEISIYDLHLGKLSWQPETGGASYDLKIAVKSGEDAFTNLISRHDKSEISKILLVLGQDYINQDNIAGTTTRGTQVSGDGRYHKLFQAGFDLARKQIETCLQIAPVEVVTAVGNHDTHISWGISHSLECFFHGNKHVSFDNSPLFRKYWSYGSTMLMFTHGDSGKPLDYPLMMATERPDLFGKSEYREGHCGHYHQTKTVEQCGVRIRTIPSLTPPDAWHSKSGFINNVRAAQSFLWSKTDGLLRIDEYNMKRLAE